MAIKKTIIKKDAQVKVLPLKKTIVSVKKNETTLAPEEAIEEVEESFVAITDIIQPNEITNHELTNEELRPQMPTVKDPRIEALTEELEEYSQMQKQKQQEKRFAKIALCIGIGFLVLMILNKK